MDRMADFTMRGPEGGPPKPPWGALPQRPLSKRSREGAVYVEFLIAFLPLFFFFLSLVQLIFVQTANLITKHAAVKAARAAVVVLPDDPKYYGNVPIGSFSGKRKEDIEQAAKIPLGTMGIIEAALAKVTVEGAVSRDSIVKVKVEYQYHCEVPWGRFTVCGFSNFKKLTGEAALPNQGADYVY